MICVLAVMLLFNSFNMVYAADTSSVFDVVVPTSVSVYVKGDGTVVEPTDFCIENNSKGTVTVSNIYLL